MELLLFPKIATTSPGGSAGDKGVWIAQEKIHGAQLVVGVSRDLARIGKRKAWLDDGDAFFGWQLLRPDLVRLGRAVFDALRIEPDRTLYLYGELFGGAYPHPQVPAIAGMSPVQTGIWYAPDIRWAPFDAVLATPGDPASAEFADAQALADAVAAAGGITPPVLARGKKTDTAAAPFRFASRVPGLFSLPPIEKNFAEGVVLKPAGRTSAAGRAVVKRKIEEFDEGRFGESEAWDANQILGVDALLALADRLVNVPRLQSARSKVGTAPDAVRDELVLDVMIDLGEAFPAAMSRLAPADEERLRTALGARASAVASANAADRMNT